MKRNQKRALTAAAATAFVLAVGGSAQAGGWDWRDDKPRFDRGKIIKLLQRWKEKREYCPPKENPIPEPSAALVFGAGLLVASRFARKSR